MTPVIRAATDGDLDAIMAIESAEFGSDAWSSDAMAADLASEHTAYVVAVAGDDVVGYAGTLAPRRSADADVQTIAVSPGSRGAGLGRALLVELARLARERGAAALFLEVRADNPVAQALYDSAGFERIAVRPRYYQPDGVDAIVMRAPLPLRTATPGGAA